MKTQHLILLTIAIQFDKCSRPICENFIQNNKRQNIDKQGLQNKIKYVDVTLNVIVLFCKEWLENALTKYTKLKITNLRYCVKGLFI